MWISLKPRAFDWEGGQVDFIETKGIRPRRRLGGFIETKGIRLRRRPRPPSQSNTLGFDETTQPPSRSNTLGFNEIHLPSFSVECPWFQWNPHLVFNFWYPQKSWNRRFTVKVSLNTVIKKLKKYVRFYLKPDFSHVWHIIPFWIPK